ncbi:MAG: hypothetical protein FWD74_09835 [Actinomycetia bacterium]|nr:hypothetical protein [Actinomycetes bacterium]
MIRLLLDTNLLIEEPDFSVLDTTADQVELCTSVLCLAELMEGEFSPDPAVAAAAVLQSAAAQATFGAGLPFGPAEHVAYRAICVAATRGGRALARARRMDMMIAATALANGMTIATRNHDDFAAVSGVVPVVCL